MVKQFLIVILSLFLFASCKNENTVNSSINKIMPLGASRVAGDRPDYESYRYELWKLLVDGNWEFDYIGTRNDPASYPGHAGLDFDDDHEGRGGWTSGQLLDGMSDWLDQAGAPDIVLLSSPGGNDALQGLSFENAAQNINQIVDIIQSANPNVTIIIEQAAPGQSFIMTSSLTTFFNQMQQEVISIASEKSTPNSEILTVDMHSGFEDSLLADLVHYNEAGAKFIAERYYDVLRDVLQ